LNNRLFVGRDASLNGNLYVNGLTIQQGDGSLNNRLFVGRDASLNGSLYVNGVTIQQGDVSMNSKLFVGNDVTIYGKLNVYEYQSNNILYTNVTTTSYTLVVAEDMSLNGKLTLIGDASINNRLFVSNDASFNNNMFVKARSIQQGDVSLNSRLFVSGDVSFNSNMFTQGTTILNGDISLNNRLFVRNDASLNGNVFINNILKPTTISESFTTIATGSSPYTLNYSTGSVFYLAPPPASNFTCNITGVPYDTGRTYVITLIIDSSTNKTFCNSVQINGSTAFTPWFANGIPTSITSGNSISQSLAIQRIIGGGSADLSSNSKVLSSVTPWY